MAITNLRIESTDPFLTILYWSQSGSHSIEIYRSTNGTDFSLLEEILANTEYEDDTVSANTRYWYKLSDDDGGTFSDTVNVTTHQCPLIDNGAGNGVALPRFDGQAQQSERLNDLSSQVESALNKTFFYGSASPSPNDQCEVCATNGAIVLDCSDGCDTFIVETSSDINSITVIGCGDICPPLDVTVPAGATVGVCGWPPGCDFDGDECFNGPIVGGATGRTARTNGLSTKIVA